MGSWQKITRSNFFIRLKNWEYWPFGIIQFPVIVYWLWLSFRSRSLFFFSASNPGIIMGGMFGESKYDVLKKLPADLIPNTILVNLPATRQDVLDALIAGGYVLPVIFKPELGERGYMVRKIDTAEDIDHYLKDIKINFVIQELVKLPLEFGVFYMRNPALPTGAVTSVVVKEMLSITGDGRSTYRELILAKERAKLQWKKLRKVYSSELNKVLPSGRTIELVSIGNHALGTKFLNGNHLINEKLSSTFDKISKQIEGFYFGRFDLRCGSLQDLYDGNIKIVELNGCGAEPAHIYDPSFHLHAAITVLFKHWRNIFEIARENHTRGVPYVTLKEGIKFYKKFKEARQ
jgi:hypothetical protein